MASTDPAASETTRLRLEGNTAFQRGNYGQAELLYTRAIEADDSDPRVYSNRANARLQLGKLEDAIADADACNGTAERGFVKHLMIKATALRRLGRRTDAKAEAEALLDRSPDHAGAKALLRSLGDLGTEDGDDADTSFSSAAGAAGSASSSSSGGGIGAAIGRFLMAGGPGVDLALASVRAAAVLGAIAYMLSGLVLDASMGLSSYYMALLAAVLLNLFHSLQGAAQRLGTLELSMRFAAVVFEQPSTPLVMLGTTFVGSRPVALVLWPMLCYEAMFLSGSLAKYVPAARSGLRYVGTLLVTSLGQVPGYDTMTDEQRIVNAHPVLGTTSAQAQLVLMAIMIIELAFPTRNLIGILLHGQNLALQYAVNPFMQQQLRALHTALHGYAHHPSVPSAVGSAFDTVTNTLSSFGDLRARAEAEAARRSAGGSESSSSCAVM